MITFTFELSLPPGALSPNARPYWRTKSKAIQAYRNEAQLVAHNLIVKSRLVEKPMLTTATIEIIYYHPTRTLQDPDNIIARMKSGVDGLTRAGILADDRDLVWIQPKRLVAKEHDRKPGVVIVISQT